MSSFVSSPIALRAMGRLDVISGYQSCFRMLEGMSVTQCVKPVGHIALFPSAYCGAASLRFPSLPSPSPFPSTGNRR